MDEIAGEKTLMPAELPKQYDQLKRLAHSAITDYENLKQMYDENQVQYEELKKRLIDTETDLQNLKAILEPACEEYNMLNKKLEVEKVCLNEAINYASEMNKANKKLKRQSQMLLDQLDEKVVLEKLATISDESELETELESPTHTTALNEKIQVLEDDIRLLEERLRKSETERVAAIINETKLAEKLKRMDTELRIACQRLHDHEVAAENFKRTSVLAWTEYGDLKSKLEMEVMLKHEAEKFAHKMLSERDASCRQSSILMTSAASDQQLMQALIEVENLTKQLESERMEGKEKISKLQETLTFSGDNQVHSQLQTELETASSEVQRLHRAVEDLEEWKRKLVDENMELRDRLNVAEDKLRPSPPPPPPPPPPCPAPFIRPPQLIIKKRDGPGTGPGSGASTPNLFSPQPNVHELALKEMMQRITTGRCLKAPKTPSVSSEPKTPSPMDDLQKILVSFKRRPSGSGGSRPPPTPPKRKPGDSVSSNTMEPDLMKKFRELEQKSTNEAKSSCNGSPTSPNHLSASTNL